MGFRVKLSSQRIYLLSGERKGVGWRCGVWLKVLIAHLDVVPKRVESRVEIASDRARIAHVVMQ